MQHTSSMLRDNIVLAVNDERSADFVIVAEGKEILSHRSVLMAQSPFLRKFLDQDPTCTRINANNAKHESMMIALRAIYAMYNRQDRNGVRLGQFFSNSRYDFSVLLSVWEISMHFKLVDVAAEVVPLILPLLSRYTAVRALRSCLKHPSDDGALHIKAESLRLIPPLLDTEEQREEWTALLGKYPFLVPLSEVRERSRSPSLGGAQHQHRPGLDRTPFHPQPDAPSGRFQAPTPLGPDTTFPGSGRFEVRNLTGDPPSVVNRFAFENDEDEEYRRRGRSGSAGARPPMVSPYHGEQEASPSIQQRKSFVESSPQPPQVSLVRGHVERYAPIDQSIHASITLEPKRRRVQQLKAELESLRNEYRDGLTQWKDEEMSMNNVLEHLEEQDVDVRKLTEELSDQLRKNEEHSASLERAHEEIEGHLKAIAENEQYISSALLYVPAAKDAQVTLSRQLDSGRFQSRDGGEAGTRISLLQSLLAELKSEKRDAQSKLQEEQNTRRSLEHLVQTEKEKTAALRRKLAAMSGGGGGASAGALDRSAISGSAYPSVSRMRSH